MTLFQVFLGYILMLIVMTYQLELVFAGVIGLGIGHVSLNVQVSSSNSSISEVPVSAMRRLPSICTLRKPLHAPQAPVGESVEPCCVEPFDGGVDGVQDVKMGNDRSDLSRPLLGS